MNAPLNIRVLTISKNTNACCNHCAFCSAGEKHLENIPFKRYVNIVERFLDWQEREKPEIVLASAIGYTHATMTYEQSKIYRELCERGHYRPLPLQMNGCIFMPEDDLARMMEGHRRAGYEVYSQTYTGFRSLHDKWAGRKGEFDYLMTMANVASELGYIRQEQILLTKRSLPELGKLVDALEKLDCPYTREIYQPSYTGWAKRLERDRIDRKDLDQVPKDLRKYLKVEDPLTHSAHLSEAETISWVRTNYRDDLLRDAYVAAPLTEQNLEWMENEDCDAIFENIIARYRDVYDRLPKMTELCELYGDEKNDKLYGLYELERKWSGQYISSHLSEYADRYNHLSGWLYPRSKQNY